VPKDEINKIDVFVADVLGAKEMSKNVWAKWFERLGGFYDKKFGGPNWREKEKEFWVLSTILCEISFSQSLKEWQIIGYFSYRV